MVDVIARDIGFCYPGAAQATLEGLSFEVSSNSTLGLLGSSGAGKTTLLKVLSGLLSSPQGSLQFDGREVLNLAPGDRGVSQVFQFPVLYESLSVLENIAFPLRALGFSKRDRRRRAQEIAALLEIGDWLEERPVNLALYQAQIAGFAKALVRPDTALVLLDEPLTAVEPALKWRLRGLLKRAQEELQVSMIYVTHDQTEALTIADRVSVLHDGGILQTGSASALYNLPAHVEVARFIGSPGMNMLPGLVEAGRLTVNGIDGMGKLALASAVSERGLEDGAVLVGFRPEWASVMPNGAAKVQSLQTIGVDDGARVGFIEVHLDGEHMQIRQSLDQQWMQRDASANISIERCVLFRDGHLVGSAANS